MRMFTTPLRWAALPVAAVLVLSACGDDADDADDAADGAELTMTDAWSREPAEGQTRTAVYGVLSNPGDEDVTVVSASSPASDQVELHETLADDDGVMRMQEREEGFVIPAGGEFVFEPGGPHIMMLDIDPATYPDPVEVELTFDGADPLTFDAEIRAIDMDAEMDMDGGDMDMEDGDMEMDDG